MPGFFHGIQEPQIRFFEPHVKEDPLWQWEMVVEQFTEDISPSLKFIQEEITDEELYWLIEVFDEILIITKSREPLQAIEQRSNLIHDKQVGQENSGELKNVKEIASMF